MYYRYFMAIALAVTIGSSMAAEGDIDDIRVSERDVLRRAVAAFCPHDQYRVLLEGGVSAALDETANQKRMSLAMIVVAAVWGEDAVSQTELGFLSCRSDLPGIKKDPILTIMWLIQAANQGEEGAQNFLWSSFSSEDPKQWRYAEVLKNKPCANELVKYFTRQAQAGKEYPTLILANWYEFGRAGLKPDLNKTLSLLEEAAEKGSIKAASRLGREYASGTVLREGKKDLRKASDLLSRVMESPWSTGDDALALALIHESGMEVGGERDLKQTHRCYKAAAIGQKSEAYLPLVRMYEFGQGTERDLVQAWMLSTWIPDNSAETSRLLGLAFNLAHTPLHIFEDTFTAPNWSTMHMYTESTSPADERPCWAIMKVPQVLLQPYYDAIPARRTGMQDALKLQFPTVLYQIVIEYTGISKFIEYFQKQFPAHK